MSKDIPSWVGRRYEILWEAFSGSTFRFDDAARVLMDKNKDA